MFKYRAKNDIGYFVEGFYSELFNPIDNYEESAIRYVYTEGASMDYPYPTVENTYSVVDRETLEISINDKWYKVEDVKEFLEKNYK